MRPLKPPSHHHSQSLSFITFFIMVKNTRVTYRRRHCYNTKSNKIRKVKTPGTLPHQFLLVPFIPRLPFNCKTTKRDLFLLGEYIYPSKMARRGTNTDGVCNGRAMAMSNGHQGISLRTQQWRKQNLPRPPDFTHPDGLSNEPH